MWKYQRLFVFNHSEVLVRRHAKYLVAAIGPSSHVQPNRTEGPVRRLPGEPVDARGGTRQSRERRPVPFCWLMDGCWWRAVMGGTAS